MPSSTDRLEKKVLLHAPRARVWRAMATRKEFGRWFDVDLDREFEPGVEVRGTFHAKEHEGIRWQMWIEEVVAERRLSFRWHPYAIDPKVDYSSEPTTLVVFELEDAPGGTLVTITESGFDSVPLARRAKAFEMNDGGWTEMSKRLAGHVDATA